MKREEGIFCVMRNGLPGKACSLIAAIALAIAVLSVTGCSLVRHTVATFRSTDHFIAHDNDSRVLIEPGAGACGDRIAASLPEAIQQVEKKQYRRFVKPVRVYVCASRESFRKHYGADVRAGVLTKLFLSPRIFDFGNEIGKKYLTHELSHLHLQQQLGIFKMNRLPMWFKEGLATAVSKGGGAHLISQKQAIASMQAGRHFVPNKADGFVFKKSPSDFGIEPHMFYRQSMMFVNYLKTADEPGFQKLLLSVQNGERLSTAFNAAYNRDIEAMWDAFLHDVKKPGKIKNKGGPS